jgi:hypothetical protein
MPPKAGRGQLWLGIGLAALVVIAAVVLVLVFVVFAGEDDGVTESTSTTLADVVTTQTTVPSASSTTTTVPPASSSTTTTEASASPEDVVRQVFAAMENQDVDALLALMDPTLLSQLPEGTDLEMVKAGIAASLADLGQMKFSDLEMTTEMTSPTTATVTITGGTATVTDAEGNTTTEDVSEASEPVTINLVKVDGMWYLESSPFL